MRCVLGKDEAVMMGLWHRTPGIPAHLHAAVDHLRFSHVDVSLFTGARSHRPGLGISNAEIPIRAQLGLICRRMGPCEVRFVRSDGASGKSEGEQSESDADHG